MEESVNQTKQQKSSLAQDVYQTGLVYLRMKSLPLDQQKEYLSEKEQEQEEKEQSIKR
jgi:hypothetical protein